MDKIFRHKSNAGGLGADLKQITAIRYSTVEGRPDLAVEAILKSGVILDASLTVEELEALFGEWNEAL